MQPLEVGVWCKMMERLPGGGSGVVWRCEVNLRDMDQKMMLSLVIENCVTKIVIIINSECPESQVR